LANCKIGGGDNPPTKEKQEYVINIRNSMKDGILNTIKKIEYGNTTTFISFSNLGVETSKDIDSNYLVIRHPGFGTVLGMIDNGLLSFTTPDSPGTLDLYTFPVDVNNPAAYIASGNLDVASN